MIPPLSISMVTIGWLAVAEGTPSVGAAALSWGAGLASLVAALPPAPLLVPLLVFPLLLLLLLGLLPQPATMTINKHIIIKNRTGFFVKNFTVYVSPLAWIILKPYVIITCFSMVLQRKAGFCGLAPIPKRFTIIGCFQEQAERTCA